jgi:hypothetical protein
LNPLAERACFSQARAALLRRTAVSVTLMDGTYRVNSTLVFGEADSGATSRGWRNHSDATLYIPSVVLHTTYTGRRQNDFNADAQARRGARRPALRRG